MTSEEMRGEFLIENLFARTRSVRVTVDRMAALAVCRREFIERASYLCAARCTFWSRGRSAYSTSAARRGRGGRTVTVRTRTACVAMGAARRVLRRQRKPRDVYASARALAYETRPALRTLRRLRASRLEQARDKLFIHPSAP